jgi:hypothetical protein
MLPRDRLGIEHLFESARACRNLGEAQRASNADPMMDNAAEGVEIETGGICIRDPAARFLAFRDESVAELA